MMDSGYVQTFMTFLPYTNITDLECIKYYLDKILEMEGNSILFCLKQMFSKGACSEFALRFLLSTLKKIQLILKLCFAALESLNDIEKVIFQINV